jgi:predicted  nucleic acid-binding Zn-ribbon protein
MTTIYIVFLTSIFAIIAFSFFSLKVYKDALSLNPKVRTLEQLESDISVAQATILNLKSQIEQLNGLLLVAQGTIEESKNERRFLDTYEQDLNTKHKLIEDLNNEIKQISEKVQKQAEMLEDLNRQITEKTTEKSSLEAQKVALEFTITNLNAKISTIENDKKSLEQEYKILEEKKERLNKTLEELREAVESKRMELNQILEDLKAANEKRESWRKEEEQLRKSNTELATKNKALEMQNANLEGIKNGLNVSIEKIEETKGKQEETMWKDLDQKPEFSINLHPEKNRNIEKESDFLHDFEEQLKTNSIIFHERTINAFHTGLKVEDISPMVVLSGISGTGKSLLPKLYAQASGMNFLTVPVQPRWDSPQDMLGFFNYMQDKYKATELSRLLWHMDIYNNNNCGWKKEDDLPINIVLLDEMNLARVEYYFSDLLSKLEFRRMISNLKNKEERSSAEIEVECGVVGKEKISRRLFVNGNTLFVGTMNEDETTQMLSDKVMDRANMIRFGKPRSLQSKPNIEGFGEYYGGKGAYTSYGDWKNFKGTNGDCIGLLSNTKRKRLIDTVTKLLGCMDQAGRPFAHRVWQSIESYVSMYPNANNDEQAYKDALSDQIEMKVLPKLNGIELDNNDNVTQALTSIENIIKSTEDAGLVSAFEKCKKPENGLFFQWKGVER